MLQCMCDGAKKVMKALPATQLGSWQNAVTTAEACWLTRGNFSQICTFVIKNYLSNTILWYGHVCMRGKDNVIEEPLYPGTSKSTRVSWLRRSSSRHVIRVAKWWSTGRKETCHRQSLSFRLFHLHISCTVLAMWDVLIHTN